VKYFFPDSQDLVDPSFDFETERRSNERLRHRDDAYAHELFSAPPYDGVLVSKGIVEGYAGNGSRYTLAQRHRLLRVGVRDFFRLDRPGWQRLPVMGDCGAFTYVREKEPPYTAEEVLSFYAECGFDLGTSVDHVILAYDQQWDGDPTLVPEELRQRQEITITLAQEFLALHRASNASFEPMGVAQGWSPLSYASSVTALQKMGYRYVALGGMVPLKSPDILNCLRAIADVRRKDVRLHLLGVTRTDQLEAFAELGVASFDSTSPLRQAFKDDKNNYYTPDRTYTAIRIPQVEGNPSLLKRIRAGLVKQQDALALEKRCLTLMREFHETEKGLESLLASLGAYEELYNPGSSHQAAYAETLRDQPWKRCPCDVCKALGHHVILFRGAERNRRRGFHNVWVFYRRLLGELGLERQVKHSLRIEARSAPRSRRRELAWEGRT